MSTAPFIAGSSGMTYRAFVPYSVLGTGLWAAAFSLLGYLLAPSGRPRYTASARCIARDVTNLVLDRFS